MTKGAVWTPADYRQIRKHEKSVEDTKIYAPFDGYAANVLFRILRRLSRQVCPFSRSCRRGGEIRNRDQRPLLPPICAGRYSLLPASFDFLRIRRSPAINRFFAESQCQPVVRGPAVHSVGHVSGSRLRDVNDGQHRIRQERQRTGRIPPPPYSKTETTPAYGSMTKAER